MSIPAREGALGSGGAEHQRLRTDSGL